MSSLSGTPPRAWLAIAAGDSRSYGGNTGYDDAPDKYYSWDSKVPNCTQVEAGDVLILWDKRYLLGCAVIDHIDRHPGNKLQLLCRTCGSPKIKPRETLKPRYRCEVCHDEFDVPESQTFEVTQYRSWHEASWEDLHGILDASALRAACVSPKSQHSIREARWDAFREALRLAGGVYLPAVEARLGAIAGGHVVRSVRVRVGQGEFRRRLLVEHGAVCAFTGPAPSAALDACHLYSYAELGRHESGGGLLMRKDLHRLFDQGLVAINPENCAIDISDSLAEYPTYAALQGLELQVHLNPKELSWIKKHWNQHRTPTS